MKAVYVTWQDPETRTWYPVGRLTYQDGTYAFAYTRGAKASKNFAPFGRMTDFDVVKRAFPALRESVAVEVATRLPRIFEMARAG